MDFLKEYLNLISILLWRFYFILIRRPLRREKNKNNRTIIMHDFDFSKVSVWNYTYWDLDISELLSDSKVTIWSYCSIASNVKFICWNHNYKHFSTFPFWSILWKNIKWRINIKDNNISDLEHTTKEIIVDDDVWIWTWAKIMSWVHIWQWAVIAAWAVVTKDIPPYAIVWWIPAKIIKYRFSEDKIKKLLSIDYKNINIKKFREIYSETIKEDFNVDYILGKLNTTGGIQS
jgi:acetyltransferase-like isoleucine patch superfamily enzyme